jgi:hypothetical protein
MALNVIAHLIAFSAAIFLSGLLMLGLLPLAPLLKKARSLYPIIMGFAGVLVGSCSVIVSAWIMSWFGTRPGWAILAMLGIGWFQNDLRRIFRAKERLVVLVEWNLLVGHELGVVAAAVSKSLI